MARLSVTRALTRPKMEIDMTYYYDALLEDISLRVGEDFSQDVNPHVYFCNWSNCWIAFDGNTADYIDNEIVVKYRGEGKTAKEAVAEMMRDFEDNQ